LEEGDLLYWKSLDEQNLVHLHFFPRQERRQLFSGYVDVVYDPQTEKVIRHSCSDCPDEEGCRHFLTLLYYSYKYLKTDILDENTVETYQGDMLPGREQWQIIVREAQIEAEGIYDPQTERIRFYFKQYNPLDIRLAATLLAGKSPEEEAAAEAETLTKNLGVFSEMEKQFLILLHNRRCSFSAKGQYISIYKKDFGAFLAIMQTLPDKFVIRETGEPLRFNTLPLQLPLRIEPVNASVFALRPVLVEELSVWFAGQPTWLLFRNEVRQVFLPFKNKLINALFKGEFTLRRKDLVYFRTIVWRELNRQHIYLDIDRSIMLPPIYDNRPSVHFFLHRFGEAVLLEGTLRYAPEVEIPLSVVRFECPLVKYEVNRQQCWFYIPPVVFSQIGAFLRKLPAAEFDRLEKHSQLVFRGEDSLMTLKKTVYELSEANWDIEIDPELQKEFVYKVPLQAQITAALGEEIDWFSYEVRYQYKDFSFTHEELRHFFKSKQQFLQTQVGRLVFLTQREVFEEVDKLLKKSELAADKVYRARVNILPYYWRLREENTALQLYGDTYLEGMFKCLLNRSLEKAEALPAYLNTVLRSYQKAGYHWLKMLQRYHLHGILADEMGLGKTIQALSVLAETPTDSISLVICPKTLLYNWAAEIEKFHTNIPYCIYEGNKQERVRLLENKNVRLFIISYSIVLNDLPELSSMQFKWIVLDEAQHIKNVTAQRTAAIKKLRCDYRLALSGTPIENDLTELWSIMDFLMPHYLGPLNRFKQEYVTDTPKPELKARLNRLASPFILRRVKKDVLFELPDKQEQISWCKLHPLQEKIYLQILDAVHQSLFPDNAKDITKLNYIHVLSALTKLRQVCNHPAMVSADIRAEAELSAKTEQLMELVDEALESGHKILVFSQFVEMLQIIKPYFEERKIAYEYLDGKTKDRQKRIDHFNNDPRLRLFLISLKTGGMGINLTAADTVILIDPWWNPMIENQAIDRTHRIGQTRKVQVFRLITKGTVEEKILNLQMNKLELFNSIIEEGQSVLRQIDAQTLKDLFMYQ